CRRQKGGAGFARQLTCPTNRLTSLAGCYPARRFREMSTVEKPVVHSDPDIMSGTTVFVGTRVPFQTLIDYLEAGMPLSELLEDFPTVSKEQAVAALEQAKDALLARARPA